MLLNPVTVISRPTRAQKIRADGRMVSVSLLENVRFLRYFPT